MVRPDWAAVSYPGVSGRKWFGGRGCGRKKPPTGSTSLKLPPPAKLASENIPQPTCIPILRLGGGKVKKEPHAGARRRTKLAVEKARGDVRVSGSSSDEVSSIGDDFDFIGRILE